MNIGLEFKDFCFSLCVEKVSYEISQLSPVVKVQVLELKFSAKIGGPQFLPGNEIFGCLGLRRGAIDHIKDQAPVIVEQQYPQIGHLVIVPEGVPVIKKSQITRNQNIQF